MEVLIAITEVTSTYIIAKTEFKETCLLIIHRGEHIVRSLRISSKVNPIITSIRNINRSIRRMSITCKMLTYTTCTCRRIIVYNHIKVGATIGIHSNRELFL